MRSPSTSPENSPRKCIDYDNDILFNIPVEEYKYIRYRSPSPEPVEKSYKYIYYILTSVIILYYYICDYYIYGISFSSNYE